MGQLQGAPAILETPAAALTAVTSHRVITITSTEVTNNNYSSVAASLFSDVTQLQLHIQVEPSSAGDAEGLVHASDDQTIRVLEVFHDKRSLSVAAVIHLVRSFPT